VPPQLGPIARDLNAVVGREVVTRVPRMESGAEAGEQVIGRDSYGAAAGERAHIHVDEERASGRPVLLVGCDEELVREPPDLLLVSRVVSLRCAGLDQPRPPTG
jgi:hypothetical protein